VIRFYPEEMARLAGAVDAARLSEELAVSRPRHWRPLADLFAFIPPSATNLYERVVRALDKDRFIATVERFGAACPYELRCLLWFLAYTAPREDRLELARRLIPTIKDACRAKGSESADLLKAMTALDPDSALQLRSDLPERLETEGCKASEDDEEEESEEELTRWSGAIQELERSGKDYDVGAVFSSGRSIGPPSDEASLSG